MMAGAAGLSRDRPSQRPQSVAIIITHSLQSFAHWTYFKAKPPTPTASLTASHCLLTDTSYLLVRLSMALSQLLS
jgi:hypothetical protein